MSPWLLASRTFRIRSRGRSVAPIRAAALAILVASVVALGVSQLPQATHTVNGKAVAAAAALAAAQAPPPPAATLFRATAPASAFHLVAKKTTSGEQIYTGMNLSPARSAQLFHFYVGEMLQHGWTLQSKSDPDAAGEWTLNFNEGTQVALLTMFTSPSITLTTIYCPPVEYC